MDRCNGERLIMSKSDKNYQPPTHDEIAACARRIYEIEGRPEGRAMEHWLAAETQLIAERKARAGQASAAKAPAKSLSSPASANTRGEGWQASGRPVTHRN
jgi:Protein of unknown function (DUF2934)